MVYLPFDEAVQTNIKIPEKQQKQCSDMTTVLVGLNDISIYSQFTADASKLKETHKCSTPQKSFHPFEAIYNEFISPRRLYLKHIAREIIVSMLMLWM